MSYQHDDHHEHSHQCGCCASIERRDFPATVGLTSLAAPGAFTLTSAAVDGQPATNAKPRIRAVFLRPDTDRGDWMSWPGAFYDNKGSQAAFTKTLSDAAKNLDVNLEVDVAPLVDSQAIDKLLAECKQSPPDGVIVTVMELGPREYWPLANTFVAGRGEIPTIVFGPMGTAFTGHLQETRKAKKCFTASTQDLTWLATGVKMLRTMWDMKNTRICIINGDKTHDQRLDVIGTTLHHIPLDRWTDELAKQEVTAEVKALAEKFSTTAQKTVEPKPEDVINAAKNYFVAKRIMAAENCQGISLNCLGLVQTRRIPCPPCMAWLTLNDEGSVGCCECDWNAAISLRLCSLLTGRPGFMQDPVPNTINNTFMGAHCSSPTRLRGFDQPAAPLILRSHSESEIGVSPQVLWPVGEPATVMSFAGGPGKILLGTGQVAANIDTPPCGGCRTSVELKMDNVVDTRDCKGFHQLFVLGNHERLFRAYCQLAGIEVVPISA
jgi:hypothetical protein